MKQEIIDYLNRYEPIFSYCHRTVLFHRPGVDLTIKKFGEEHRRSIEQFMIADLDKYFRGAANFGVTEVPEHWHWRPYQKWFWPTADMSVPDPKRTFGHLSRGGYSQHREWVPLEGGTDACANESAIGRNIIILLTDKLRRRE